ncbi:MAG: hypothetical protein ACYDDZ_11080, partial [Acidimicrobiales bacterium]
MAQPAMTEHHEMLCALARIEHVLIAENLLPAETGRFLRPSVTWRFDMAPLAQGPEALSMELSTSSGYPLVLQATILTPDGRRLWRHMWPT